MSPSYPRQFWIFLTAIVAVSILGLFFRVGTGDLNGSLLDDKRVLNKGSQIQSTIGAVASESALCSRIGTDFLHSGANAADAIIATVFCIGVVAMYHGGIGGGGFALVRSSTGAFEVVDFREAAPEAAYEDMFKSHEEYSLTGGLASGVPGELRGLQYIHQHYGSRSWSELIQPSIRAAQNGFRVSQDLVDMMDLATEGKDNFFVEDPVWAEDFAPKGTRLAAGDIITRKRYGKTLAAIAENGPEVFYRGEMADVTIAALQSARGIMSNKDLRSYRVKSRRPVSIGYRDYRLISAGAPAGGSVALSALKIFEGYDHTSEPSEINLTTHRLEEAFRFAYGQVSLGLGISYKCYFANVPYP